MTMPWLRWYGGTCEDPKFRQVARMVGAPVPEIVAVWALILEGANAHEDRGRCNYNEKYIAAVYDLDPARARAILKAMEEVYLLEKDSGGLFVSNWNKRQFKSDSSTSRTRQWRGTGRAGGADAPPAAVAPEAEVKPEPESFPEGYAFEGKVIRLNHRDFHAWSTKYNTEPDLKKWLRERDEWLSTLKKNHNSRKNWFMSTSADLHRRHRERTIGPVVKPVSPI